MGSAASYQLARRGARVLGIDQFAPPHDLGSTHGETRVTRLAIGEGEHYTPLVIRSHEIWRVIERETGADLLTAKGGLIISSDGKSSVMHVEGFFRNTVAAARKYGIAHERLDAAEIRRRYPQFAVRDDEYGYFEPGAGFVRPEACIRAQLDLARKYGAELHVNETVLGFDPAADRVTVTTDKGTYSADQLIVAAGAWLPQILGGHFARFFQVFRQVLYWFDVEGNVAPFRPERFPIFIWELQESRQAVYGFPVIDGASIKIATEQYDGTTTPQTVARTVAPQEIAAMYQNFVAPCFPAVGPRCLRTATCLYTVTPDFGFVIDRHPASDRVIIASPCSGHGFKHSAAIGEALAELVLDGKSRHDLGPFRLDRL